MTFTQDHLLAVSITQERHADPLVNNGLKGLQNNFLSFKDGDGEQRPPEVVQQLAAGKGRSGHRAEGPDRTNQP